MFYLTDISRKSVFIVGLDRLLLLYLFGIEIELFIVEKTRPLVLAFYNAKNSTQLRNESDHRSKAISVNCHLTSRFNFCSSALLVIITCFSLYFISILSNLLVIGVNRKRWKFNRHFQTILFKIRIITVCIAVGKK